MYASLALSHWVYTLVLLYIVLDVSSVGMRCQFAPKTSPQLRVHGDHNAFPQRFLLLPRQSSVHDSTSSEAGSRRHV